jgi:aspartate aminotransferase-like enzyme
MISKHVNLSTGPVGITRQVQKGLQGPPVSHRSIDFRNLYDETTALLSKTFQVRETYLLTGSGTLANDVMLQEIKSLGGRGLILSNGEFGDRLIMQANRIGLNFLTYRLVWGNPFDFDIVENLLIAQSLKWLLCCHCETSTGMIIDIKQLTDMATAHHAPCFIDCMSTVGTMPLNLSGVAMATASSGKGLSSIPGLAIVISNIEPDVKASCPLYLDLSHYKISCGIPFTIPSNLLKALYTSIRQKLHDEQYLLIAKYRKIFFNSLDDLSLVPFSNEHTCVFTIVPPESTMQQLINHFSNCQLEISYESDYLKKRQWCQLATFGYYTDDQLRKVSDALFQVGSIVAVHGEKILPRKIQMPIIQNFHMP